MGDGANTYGVELVRGPVVELEPHAQACTTIDELREVVRRTTKPLAIDLFSGAGGLSLGLSQAGFDVVLAVDTDERALATHRAYHPGLSVDWDLGDELVVRRVADLVRELDVSVVAGGPPCQPFSRAGRSMIRRLVRDGVREKHDRRRDLWESFLTVVEKGRPAAVIMENVPDMALDRGMVILRTMIERLESLDYSVEEHVVETWRFGVPQMRQRLILVALADGLAFEWPTESPDRISLENAIGDLPPVEGGWRPNNGDGPDRVASGWAPYGGPKTSFQRQMRHGVDPAHSDRVYDHITRPVREDDARAFAQMDHTTRYSELDDELKRYRDDIFDDKYKRLDPNGLSRTITAHIAKDGYWYIHPYEDRTITIREAARIQTFPDWFRFAGPPSAAFRQIGNAVPVSLARHVGTAVLEAIHRREPAPVTTRQTATALAEWIKESPPVRIPWLGATTRWQVIQSELLWSRLKADLIGLAWTATRALEQPELTLAAWDLLERVAVGWDRADRLGALYETAQWFSVNRDTLTDTADATDLLRAPHVSPAVADLACRVVPGDAEDPVITGSGVLRVAARFEGSPVDRRNRLSDGRLALARLIGGEDSSHQAHLALIELANGVCGPGEPDCGHCPLAEWCVEAAVRPVQGTLGVITNQGLQQTAGPSS